MIMTYRSSFTWIRIYTARGILEFAIGQLAYATVAASLYCEVRFHSIFERLSGEITTPEELHVECV